MNPARQPECKFEFLQIHHNKGRSKEFSAGRNTVGPISIFSGKRGGTYGQGLVVTNTGRCCKLVNSGSRSVDGAVWTVLSEVDNISSLTEEKRASIKAFLYS